VQVADVVPDTHPIRPWAETVPWAALVAAVEPSFAPRFPPPTPRGRPPVSTHVVLAWECLKPALTCAAAPLGRRWRTAGAVLDAGGITAVRVDRAQDHCGLPAGLAQVRRRLDAPLRAAWLALPAATAREDGCVSPAPLVVDTWPSAPGSPRVTAAATLSKAPQKSAKSSRSSPCRVPPEAGSCRGQPSSSRMR
jgi:hypothetical protein